MELPGRFVLDQLHAAEVCGVAPSTVLGALGLTEDQLREHGRRVPWNDVAELTERIGAILGTNERIEEWGRLSVAFSAPWAFRQIVPQAVSPRLLFRIAFQFTGPAIFPHMGHALETRPDGRLRLTLSLRAPYRGSEPFFRACVGGIRSIPTLVGFEPALVAVASIGPRACVYDITPPPSRTLFSRVRGAFGALRGESALFEEMGRQHEAMQEVFGVLLRTQTELHQLMERIPDPLVVHRDGVILWTNKAFLTALKGATLDELRGKNVIDLIHPADKDAAAARFARTTAPPKLETFRVHVADGSFRTFELSEPQAVIFEEVPARMELARDVTERDLLREQLVLADRMSQLGFLAAGVAHEINNPLAYALAALDATARDLDAARIDAARKSLAIAREGAERVRGITNDLRMFTRGGEEHAEVVDLTQVVRATADLAAANIRTRGSLVIELRPTPTVFVDAGRLGQVFMNLLVNAIDALDGGNPATSRIEVRAFTDATGCAVVEVEDNGRGIPPEVQTRIFEPFFTTKGPRAGSGLGLAICQRIVSDFGGHISLAPRSGPGTVFRVVLPPHHEPVAKPVTEARSVHRLRVLVVDDEAPLANALGRMLEDEHNVDVVTSGEDALHRLNGGAEYDAILCDLMMAGVGGMDVYEKLRAGARPALARRLVFMTGGAFSANAQRFLGEVKNPCLDKPFTKEEVLGALDEVQGLG